MRAVICEKWGGPGDLKVADVAPPVLVEGCVRIRVMAAGVNFADTLMIAGHYQLKPPFPFSPGLEVAGEVTECAPGVTRARVGDRVLAFTGHGGFAQEAVTAEANVYPLPDAMDFVTAAAFPVVYFTSHFGLANLVRLNPGETLLVLGAAGGVGLAAVEIAKHLGATVIACAGGPEKLAVARDHGADHVVDYRNENIREQAKALTGGAGVDAVFDPVGGDAFTAALRGTRPGGRILIVGFASGTIPQIPANILLVKNVTVIGYSLGGHRKRDPELADRSLGELYDWWSEGALKPLISRTVALENAAEALQALAGRKSTGKIVLTVGDTP
ncbi:MAG TPA: NADPH:quinone oxidoreductase family protein [Rhodospirillales bacterium]|nr:NADPH:quinone oxidoreductase family protein [Rhodospirillales bacterium]